MIVLVFRFPLKLIGALRKTVTFITKFCAFNRIAALRLRGCFGTAV